MNAELGDLTDAIEGLIAALDGRDPRAIELANDALTLSVDRLRTQGGWRGTPEELARIDHALVLAEAARIRVKLLADLTHRQIEMLAKGRSNTQDSAVYGRKGRRI